MGKERRRKRTARIRAQGEKLPRPKKGISPNVEQFHSALVRGKGRRGAMGQNTS